MIDLSELVLSATPFGAFDWSKAGGGKGAAIGAAAGGGAVYTD